MIGLLQGLVGVIWLTGGLGGEAMDEKALLGAGVVLLGGFSSPMVAWAHADLRGRGDDDARRCLLAQDLCSYLP